MRVGATLARVGLTVVLICSAVGEVLLLPLGVSQAAAEFPELGAAQVPLIAWGVLAASVVQGVIAILWHLLGAAAGSEFQPGSVRWLRVMRYLLVGLGALFIVLFLALQLAGTAPGVVMFALLAAVAMAWTAAVGVRICERLVEQVCSMRSELAEVI